MGNCKDCKHWERGHDYTERFTIFECSAVDYVDPKDKIGESDFAMYAYAHDDSGLSLGLRTGPMFGCVKFENKSNVS